MILARSTILIDLLSTIWIVFIVGVLFIWIPIVGYRTNFQNRINISLNQRNDRDVYSLGLWLRNILIITIGITVLGYFNLISWLTVILLYLGCTLFNYFKSYSWKARDFKQAIQNKVIGLVDFLDRGISLVDITKNIGHKCQEVKQICSDRIFDLVSRRGIAFLILLTAILGFTLLLRWEYPLAQLRFSNPDNYNTLLITRQLLANNYPNINHLPILPAFASIICLLGSIEPMQTIRFITPILGIVLVFSLGFLVRVLTKNAYSSLIAIFTLGVYLFTLQVGNLEIDWLNRIVESLNNSLVRQWTGNELELGTIFLLLGLSYCFGCDDSWRKTRTFKINFFCSIILVGMCAPPLLIIFAIASIGLIGDTRLTLTAITLSWILLAIFAAMSQGQIIWLQSFLLTLPVALSLLAALLFSFLSDLSKLLSLRWGEMFCLGIIFSLSINFLLPLAPNLIYVEYDMAARKTLDIKNHFPAQSWTLVAPVEQLSEIYGAGWYQDLALFVEQNADEARKPGFDFPILSRHLFIMVEKIPFVTFPNEPDTLPNSVLSDRTYRYYRSSAGRASLEYEALRMCKAYSRYHSTSSNIYYEDQELIIYHFTQNLLDAKKA